MTSFSHVNLQILYNLESKLYRYHHKYNLCPLAVEYIRHHNTKIKTSINLTQLSQYMHSGSKSEYNTMEFEDKNKFVHCFGGCHFHITY